MTSPTRAQSSPMPSSHLTRIAALSFPTSPLHAPTLPYAMASPAEPTRPESNPPPIDPSCMHVSRALPPPITHPAGTHPSRQASFRNVSRWDRSTSTTPTQTRHHPSPRAARRPSSSTQTTPSPSARQGTNKPTRPPRPPGLPARPGTAAAPHPIRVARPADPHPTDRPQPERIRLARPLLADRHRGGWLQFEPAPGSLPVHPASSLPQRTSLPHPPHQPAVRSRERNGHRRRPPPSTIASFIPPAAVLSLKAATESITDS